jgi:hypothetical protein
MIFERNQHFAPRVAQSPVLSLPTRTFQYGDMSANLHVLNVIGELNRVGSGVALSNDSVGPNVEEASKMLRRICGNA